MKKKTHLTLTFVQINKALRMETKQIPPRPSVTHLRRYSLPTDKPYKQIRKTPRLPSTRSKASSSESSTTFILDNIQYPNPELSMKISLLTDGAPAKSSLLSPKYPKAHLHSNQNSTSKTKLNNNQKDGNVSFRLKTSTPDSESVDSGLRSNLKAGEQVDVETPKNEAEIVDDVLLSFRRSSLPNVTLPPCSSRGRKGSNVDSVDRELRSLHKNNVEEKRLKTAFSQLDRQSFAGTLEHRFKKNEIRNQQMKILKRSPSADDWLLMRKSRTNTLQERERDDIARRFSRRARHFRAPPPLLDTVSKIRSYALFRAGFAPLAEDDTLKPDDDVTAKMASLSMTRRHTISGDEIANCLPVLSKDSGIRQGRRMTLGDIKTIQEILEFRKGHSASRVYVEDLDDEINCECSEDEIESGEDGFDEDDTTTEPGRVQMSSVEGDVK